MSSALEQMWAHNNWANRRLIEACKDLDDKVLGASVDGTYGAIKDTLLHIVASQEGYAALLTEKSREEREISHEDEFPGFDRLAEISDSSGKVLSDVAEQVADKTYQRPFGGKEWKIPGKVVLTQMINHATEHRAHINTILTQNGVEPVNLDGWSHGFEVGGIVEATP
jgi:uncharacterized damage-inducible protein DinB